jgi:hypothetical protein
VVWGSAPAPGATGDALVVGHRNMPVIPQLLIIIILIVLLILDFEDEDEDEDEEDLKAMMVWVCAMCSA